MTETYSGELSEDTKRALLWIFDAAADWQARTEKRADEALVAGDGERENFHRSARALPAARGHAGSITCRHGTAGHNLNS